MARESRRKRDERKFGKPERLADIAMLTHPSDWKVNTLAAECLRQKPQLVPTVRSWISDVCQDLARAIVVRADSPALYFYGHDRDVWDVTEDIPNAAPTHPLLFVEFAVPRVWTVDGGERRVFDGPELAGVLFEAIDAEAAGYLFPHPISHWDVDYHRHENARWFVRADFIVARGGIPTFMAARRIYAVGGDGKILFDPIHLALGLDAVPADQSSLIANALTEMWLIPSLLAVSFMHCQNVALEPVEPDAAINRERRKAGLKPFVRYHTINIEPMKRVLRTEGGAETHGLKRALHICRGHFATYTDRMFGRSLAAPVTVWRPAHVRGSLDEGVVVKDYAVSGPNTN